MNTDTQIPNWPEYTINHDGAVKRITGACGAKVGRVLKWTVMNTGYAKVALCRDSCKTEYLVHRLVAMTFLGDPDGFDVCHYDGNKLNNTLSNLRIDTRKGNMADQIRMGKTPRGTKCGSNKYTNQEILGIRERFASGIKVSQIHKETGIPKPTLYSICSRNTWNWL